MMGFVLFEQFHGKAGIHSSKIRGRWLAENWPEGAPFGPAEPFRLGRKYDALVFQKVYWWQYAEHFDGLKILDMCDADFLHYGYPIKQMIENCDGVTCSTEALAQYVAEFTDKPVAYIEDRFDFTKFPRPKEPTNNNPPIVGWHGYSENYPMLDSAIPTMAKLGVKKLIVIADRRSPYRLPVGMDNAFEIVNYPWSEQTVLPDLKRCDITINPQGKTGRWRFKSKNKTIMSYALGLPAAHDEPELLALFDPAFRRTESQRVLKIAHDQFDIKDSVKELIEFMKICAAEAHKPFPV